MSQYPSLHGHNRDTILLHESTQNVLKTHVLVSNAIPTQPRARNQMDADSCSQNNEMKSHLTISSIATHEQIRQDGESKTLAVRSPVSLLGILLDHIHIFRMPLVQWETGVSEERRHGGLSVLRTYSACC